MVDGRPKLSSSQARRGMQPKYKNQHSIPYLFEPISAAFQLFLPILGP